MTYDASLNCDSTGCVFGLMVDIIVFADKDADSDNLIMKQRRQQFPELFYFVIGGPCPDPLTFVCTYVRVCHTFYL